MKKQRWGVKTFGLHHQFLLHHWLMYSYHPMNGHLSLILKEWMNEEVVETTQMATALTNTLEIEGKGGTD